MFALVGYLLWKNSNKLKDPKESGLAILVIRNNTGDADLDYYGQSLASEIRTRISMSKQFQFISGLQAVLPYTDGQKTTREIGEELNVDFILSGLYQKAGNKIKIELELVDAATGKLVWPLSLQREVKDILEGKADIALDVLNRFTENSSSEEPITTVSLEAKTKNARGFELFYRGGAADSGAFQGMRLFKEAIALDSSYIDAWINLMEAEGFAYLNDWIDSKDNLDRYLAYIDTHFPGTWQRDLAHGIYAYKVSHKYDESETYLNKVLASDPQNIMALGNLSFVYKRKLDFKHALLLKQKRLMIDPGNAGEWKDLGDIFRLMGDYKNALKATLKASELSGAPNHPNMAVYTSVFGNLPLEQLPAHVKSRASTHFGIVNSSMKGDWKEVTRRALSSKTYIWICTSYGQRGMTDSARYWGNFAIKNTNDNKPRYLAFAGNREKALEAIENGYRAELETGDDKMLFCYKQIERIIVFVILREYAEATKELKQLNADFPEFGDYGPFSAPWFQRARREYPLFQEALDNLKLKRSAELEQIIKF